MKYNQSDPTGQHNTQNSRES